MKLTVKSISYLTFWKRSPQSIESIQKLSISAIGDAFELHIENKESQSRILSSNEVEALLSRLENEYHIQETKDEYKAFRYENDKDNFNLKFFLEIDFKNYTYLAVKGIHPFKQPYYKEISELFSQFFH